jgi:type IV secretory pathway VirB4 component
VRSCRGVKALGAGLSRQRVPQSGGGNDRSGAARFVHGVDAVHFESQCFITFTYLPPAEGMTRLGDFFIDRPNNKVRWRVSYRAHFDHFLGQVDQIVNLMASFMPEVHPLDDARR